MKKLLLTLALALLFSAAPARSLAAGDPADPALFPVRLEVHLTTPYYSLTLPEDWLGAFTVRTVVNESGLWLKLFFTQDPSGYQGHLFSVYLVEDGRYEIIPDHELVGELWDAEGRSWHVVAVYPTDVQYSKEGRESYMALFREAGDILATLEPAVGCTYQAAQTE